MMLIVRYICLRRGRKTFFQHFWCVGIAFFRNKFACQQKRISIKDRFFNKQLRRYFRIHFFSNLIGKENLIMEVHSRAIL